MTRCRLVVILGFLEMSGVAACAEPTGVTLQELHVSGTVTSSQDGSPIEGVSVAVAYRFVGLFNGGEGSGESVQTGADGTYSLQFGSPVGDPIQCRAKAYWIRVYLPNGWTMATASTVGDALFLHCTEALQVIDVQLTPTS